VFAAAKDGMYRGHGLDTPTRFAVAVVVRARRFVAGVCAPRSNGFGLNRAIMPVRLDGELERIAAVRSHFSRPKSGDAASDIAILASRCSSVFAKLPVSTSQDQSRRGRTPPPPGGCRLCPRLRLSPGDRYHLTRMRSPVTTGERASAAPSYNQLYPPRRASRVPASCPLSPANPRARRPVTARPPAHNDPPSRKFALRMKFWPEVRAFSCCRGKSENPWPRRR